MLKPNGMMSQSEVTTTTADPTSPSLSPGARTGGLHSQSTANASGYGWGAEGVKKKGRSGVLDRLRSQGLFGSLKGSEGPTSSASVLTTSSNDKGGTTLESIELES